MLTSISADSVTE